MPNLFDQFDASSDKSSGNLFDQFDASPTRAQQLNAENPTMGRSDVLPVGEVKEEMPPSQPAAASGKRSGLLWNAAAGSNEGIASALGAPVDAGTWVLNKAINAVRANLPGGNAAGYPDVIQHPVGGSESIQNAMSAINPDADPSKVEANTGLERGVRSTAAFLAGLPAPGAAAETVGRLGSAASAMARPVADAVSSYVAPLTKAGQEQIAAKQLADNASDRFAAQDTLENPPAPLVPGSQPTTGQLTGDMGILGQERKAETENPEPFIQRRADQNDARVAALNGVQQGGNAADVPSLFRQQLDAIDQTHQQNEANAALAAQAQKDAAQTNVENVTSAADTSNEDAANALADAQRKALDARTQLPVTQPPEQVGAALRQPAIDARVQAKANENQLWDTVEQHGPLAVDGTPIRDRANDLISSMGKYSQPLTSAEQPIFAHAMEFPDTSNFKDLGNLRSWIGTAAQEELGARGRSPAWGRLVQLKGAVENSIDSTLNNAASNEAEAVRNGTLLPDDTIAANLQKQADAWKQQQSPNAPQPAIASTTPQPLTPQAVQDRQAAAAATANRFQTFDRGPVGAILKNTESTDQFKMPDYAVPGSIFHPGEGSFQKIDALRTAAGADNVDPVLRDYAAADLRSSAMRPDGTLDPNRIFTWQQNHADALRAFPELQGQASDIASAEAAVPAGVQAQKLVAKQGTQDINAASKSALQTTQQADQMVADAATARRQALSDYQKTAAGRLLGLDDPDDVTRTIGSVFGTQKANASMKELSDMIGDDQSGRQGVRQAIADYMSNRFVGNTEVGTSGQGAMKSDQFQTFLRKNQGPLSYWFEPEELDSMNAIATDLQRSNRSNVAMKLPARSNTAQDQAANLDTAQSLLRKVFTRTAGESALGLGALGTTGVTGATIAGGGILAGRLLTAARDAGLANANKLVEQALLNPDLAKALLAKVPANMGQSGVGAAVAKNARVNTLAKKLSGRSMFGNDETPQFQEGHARGGEVGSSRYGGETNIVSRLKQNGINP